ncbi:hypothetical protein LI328DRAFT_138156 [Trichoderma asperelloides]|nr:hypothetical protein LI328DRAFT_138156 [Trichoderma asperelloides]
MTAATTRLLQRRRILAGGLRGAACTCTLWMRRQSNLLSGGERERMKSCALLRGAAHSPHSALPDAGTEPAAGSSHQPWPATVCRIKGRFQDRRFCLLQ